MILQPSKIRFLKSSVFNAGDEMARDEVAVGVLLLDPETRKIGAMYWLSKGNFQKVEKVLVAPGTSKTGIEAAIMKEWQRE